MGGPYPHRRSGLTKPRPAGQVVSVPPPPHGGFFNFQLYRPPACRRLHSGVKKMLNRAWFFPPVFFFQHYEMLRFLSSLRFVEPTKNRLCGHVTRQ